jgi:outer membrane PBP1 activator LpoA protein
MCASLRPASPGHESEWQRRLRPWLAVGLIAITVACQPLQQPTGMSLDKSRQAESLADQGRHDAAARIYLELAEQGSATNRQKNFLLAANEQRLAGSPETARTIVDRLPQPIAPQNQRLWAQVAGAVALDLDEPQTALEAVATGLDSAEGQVAANLLAIKAEALFRLGRPIDATNALLDRELWLDDSAAIAGNQRRLWNSYSNWGDELSPELAQDRDDAVLTGWLDLGYVAWSGKQNPAILRGALTNWQLGYPQHPANQYLLPELLADLRSNQTSPNRTALLLPLSGRQKGAAAAVRDGFLAAHFSAAGEIPPPPIRVYDTAETNARDAYERAIRDGADFIVGPLLKNAAEQIAAGPVSVTTLALNFLAEDSVAPAGFFQFALSPEDEARQAALRAVSAGQLRAIGLAPNNAWGKRLLNSFAAELESSGGKIIDYRYYDPAAADYSQGIEDLLLISESTARADRLQANLSINLDFEPRRRADIDLIFMAANAKSGKLIRPQLRFHFAGKIPTYATSAIYQEAARGNHDLNGIMFPDIPWILSPDEDTIAIRQTLETHWPNDAARRSRFYALGYDAYQLMPALFNQAGNITLELTGKTGTLYMSDGGRVRRQLPWAKFRRGKAVLMAPLPVATQAESARVAR